MQTSFNTVFSKERAEFLLEFLDKKNIVFESFDDDYVKVTILDFKDFDINSIFAAGVKYGLSFYKNKQHENTL